MLYGGYQPKQKRPENMSVVSVPTMPNVTNGNMFIKVYGYEIKGRASGRVYLEGVCFGFDEGWWDSPYIKPDET